MNQRKPLSCLLFLLVVVALTPGWLAQPVELDGSAPSDRVASDPQDSEQARGDLGQGRLAAAVVQGGQPRDLALMDRERDAAQDLLAGIADVNVFEN